jgi:rod shape-determining protein MreB
MRRRSNLLFLISDFTSNLFKDLLNPLPSLGVDMGSSQLRLYLEGKGVILKEKSFIVQNTKTKEYIAFGNEAYEMLGKTPPNLLVFRPIERGRVADFDGAMYLLKKCMDRALNPYQKANLPIHFNGLFSVPLGLTEVEEMAIMEVGQKIGARKVHLVETPIAAGFGLGAPVLENTGTFLIDFGGGTTEISSLSLGGVVSSKILRVGGIDLNEALVNYLRIRYGILIGEKTAEEIKINLGSMMKKTDTVLEISGRSVENGMPKTLNLKCSLLFEPLYPYFGQIIEAVRDLVEQTPPELIKDLHKFGFALIGSSANFVDLGKYLTEELKINIKVYHEADHCVVNGLGWLINHPDILKKVAIKFG